MRAPRAAASTADDGPSGLTLTLKSKMSSGRSPMDASSSARRPPWWRCPRTGSPCCMLSSNHGAHGEKAEHGGDSDDAPCVGDLGGHRTVDRVAQAVVAGLG